MTTFTFTTTGALTGTELVHHWSHPTTPAGPGWDIVISDSVQLMTEKGFMARAALGEAEIIQVVVDDPDGTYDFKRLHRWYMVETATEGQQLVWNGYIGDQHISRGDEGETIYPVGTGRRWHLDVVQENAILSYRVITGADGNRPIETPGDRLRWLLDSSYLSTVFDHGLIDWSGLDTWPVMDAVDYRPQTAADVARDISLVTGFNHYVRYRDESADIELAFYNPNTSTLDTSTLKVSNDDADLNAAGDYAANSTYAPSMNTTLDREGDRVAAGVAVPFSSSTATKFVYGYRLATSYEFGFIDMVAPSANIKTQAKAEELRDRLLAQHSTQDEKITSLRIRTPAANVNDVKHGQRMQAKFTHLPGWESLRWARVVSKAFGRPDNEDQRSYDVDLELSPQEPITSKLLGVVFHHVVFGNDETLVPNVTIGTALGIPWNLLAFESYPYGDPSGAGSQGALSVSLWWTDEAVDNTNVMYVNATTNAIIGAGVYQVSGLREGFVATAVHDADLITRPGTNSFGAVTVSETSVLFGAYGTQLLGYAYGQIGTGILDTITLNDHDLVGREYEAYPGGDQDINPPWVFIGYKSGTGAMQLDTEVETSYNYTPNGRAWVAAAIPTDGSFSIIQSVYDANELSGADLEVSLPGSL